MASSLALGDMGAAGEGLAVWRYIHLGDVSLADHMFSWLDLPGISGDDDTTSLTAAVWLADVGAGFSLMAIGLEVPIATCGEGLVRGFCESWLPQGLGSASCCPVHALPGTLIPLPSPKGQSLEGAEVVNPFLPRYLCLGSRASRTHSAGRHQVRGKMLYSVG